MNTLPKPKNKEIKISQVQQIVSDVMEIPFASLTVRDGEDNARKIEKVIARQMSMFFSRKFTKASYAMIGEKHGGRDHATVIYAIKAIETAIETRYKPVTKHYYVIQDRLRRVLFIQKNILIKNWIKNRVPLEKRRDLLCKMTA